MKALQVLERLIQSIFMLDRWKLHLRPGKPGEVVASLSDKERAELNNLTSKEIEESTPPMGAAYWCDDYYKAEEQNKLVREAKLNFDKTALKK